jgi:tetratricopeptide (TPR) repeat protein
MAANLEGLLARGADNAGLRLALSSLRLELGNAEEALRHAEAAIALDPGYSAAWRALGRARAVSGRAADAIAAYERGIEVAEQRGDRQAAKEMRVFLRRLQKRRESADARSGVDEDPAPKGST